MSLQPTVPELANPHQLIEGVFTAAQAGQARSSKDARKLAKFNRNDPHVQGMAVLTHLVNRHYEEAKKLISKSLALPVESMAWATAALWIGEGDHVKADLAMTNLWSGGQPSGELMVLTAAHAAQKGDFATMEQQLQGVNPTAVHPVYIQSARRGVEKAMTKGAGAWTLLIIIALVVITFSLSDLIVGPGIGMILVVKFLVGLALKSRAKSNMGPTSLQFLTVPIEKPRTNDAFKIIVVVLLILGVLLITAVLLS